MKWFKHYSDSSDDEFISELEDIFGLEGYARWWKLLEVVASQMDSSNRCSASYSWVKWQTFLKGKRNKLETFLKHSEKQRKIILKQTGNILEIKIPKLLELRDEYSRKSGHTPDRCQDKVAQEAEQEEEVDKEKNAALFKRVREVDKTDFQKVYDAGCKISSKLVTADTAFIRQWISAGASVELDIIPTVTRLLAKNSNIGGWGYFTAAVMDSKKTRETPAPEGKVQHGNKPTSRHSGFENQDYYAGTEGRDVC